MRISTKGCYAIRALTYLANLYDEDREKTATIKEISSNEHISARYLENIFVKLRKGGILQSVYGRKGGFRLATDPRNITLFQILDAVETGFATTDCLLNRSLCDRAEHCGTRKVWEALYENTKKFLNNITLYEVAVLNLPIKI